MAPPRRVRGAAGDREADMDPLVVEGILDRAGRERRDLPAILHALQDRYGYLPEPALRHVAQRCAISPADIEGVSTFYPRFRHRPAGRHIIRVCVGTACFVKGGETVYEAFRQALQLEGEEDTDAGRLFTVEKAACLGCCMLAPVAQIDETVYGHLSRDSVRSVLRDHLGRRAVGVREPGATRLQSPGHGSVSICTCTSCRASGSLEVFEAFAAEARSRRLPVTVRPSGCPGISYRSPVAVVDTGDGVPVRYAGVEPRDSAEILRRHFRAPRAAELRRSAARLLDHLEGARSEPVRLDLEAGADASFWAAQRRIVTADWGADPLDLAAYREAGGFGAIARCVEVLGPEGVIRVIEGSGLRGRGGAGYPTGAKWRDVRHAPGERKHVLCNADEGDPGAFMDRLILESFPFRVLEGVIIAAFAVGARDCRFYIRAEYPLAVARVRRAIDLCTEAGILGHRAPGFASALTVTVVQGEGAFVCGEETAMIAAMEGRRPLPRSRPPYPSRGGLHGEPTLVNNVETLATVPWIVTATEGALRAVGTPRSPGTKTFALAGKILRGGLIEVPMGITIRRIVEEIGGGLPPGRRLKAVQIGGPSGGCIPERLADLPVDYESLTRTGAMMGSGGLVVLDDTDCMVEVARYFTDFTRRESCGACTFCRVGIEGMHAILDRLCTGASGPGDLERLEELAHVVRQGSLCGLGRSAPNPVLTTLEYFRDEYEEHQRGRCPAKRCKALVSYHIGEECIGCTRCAQRCPALAIEAHPYERHRIDDRRCIRCGTCRQACPSGAVHVVDRIGVGGARP